MIMQKKNCCVYKTQYEIYIFEPQCMRVILIDFVFFQKEISYFV